MEHIILPNNDVVDYNDELHEYFVNGIKVPSITQLISAYFGDIYGDVPEDVLNKAASHGTNVHQEIQDILEGNSIEINYIETNNFINILAPRLFLDPINCEKIVVIYKDGKPVAAGRYDLLAFTTELHKPTLIDYKTTQTLHRQRVIYQLNLYKMGLYQSKYIDEDVLNSILLCVCQIKGSIKRHEFLPNLPEITLKNMVDKALENYYIDKKIGALNNGQ